MPVWTCPECKRQFGRPKQSHECAPAMSIEEYFSTGPVHERPVFEAVAAHLDTLGDVHVEPVSVGIFLKHGRRFAELRPMQKWVGLSFSLRHEVSHRLIVRKPIAYHGRYWHTANVRSADDVDDEVKQWLTEAYLDAASEP
ncbi:MAG: hypothetical protein JO248_13205 [Acidimicrobiia bacterium]|nr:hypothetical protein [Acidimicrobiia bacterium]